MKCKDCFEFEIFEYRTHGLCNLKMKKKVMRSDNEACKYFDKRLDK